MRPAPPAALTTRLEHCYRQYQRGLTALERDWARASGQAPETIAGRGRERIVEAQVRQYLLDPILEYLGWELSSPQRMVVEDGADPVLSSDKRRHLDYHGRDLQPDGAARSLLLLEAKRARVTLPNMDPAEIPNAVVACLTWLQTRRGDHPLTQEWTEYLKTLIDYAERIRENTGAPPRVVVMSNGDWFLVFSNVEQTLLSEGPAMAAIHVYSDPGSVYYNIERFWDTLSYAGLSDRIPEQHPDALRHFVQAPGSRLRGVFTSDVEYHIHRDPNQSPVMSARVLMRIEVPGGAWVTFRFDGYHFVNLRPDAQKTVEDLADLSLKAAQLLEAVERYAAIELLTPAQAAPYFQDQRGEPQFCENVEGEQYRVLSGRERFFVNVETRWDSCPYHDYAKCLEAQHPHPDGRQGAPRSVPPRMYFVSGHPLHCSHRTMFEARKSAECLIAGFEEALCCKRCAFNERCYPPTQDWRLPCVHV